MGGFRSSTVRLLILASLCASCDDDGRNTTMGPSGPGGTETLTVTGTTRALSEGNCVGDTHAFTAGTGTITVTLVNTSPAESLTAEICEPGTANKPDGCTLGRTLINVGQTLGGARKGGDQQVLSLLPVTCGAGGAPSPNPITYTAAVTFPR